tara:strand:+ start:586 stop:1230 length:645 start_codon:yes stop_codon:yes gene_type:complete
MASEKFKFWAFKLSGIIIVVFLLQLLVNGFTEIFVLNDAALSGFQFWRFVSSVFLHGGVAHLVFNLFALVLFGSILEKLIGSRRFLIVFFVTGILANLVSVNFYSSSLGASGAIFGVIGALIIVRPGLPIWAFGMPMPIFIAGIFWAGADILGAVGFFTGNPIDNTGNIAHLSGMAFGFIFGGLYRRLISKRKKGPRIEIDEGSLQRWEDDYMK